MDREKRRENNPIQRSVIRLKYRAHINNGLAKESMLETGRSFGAVRKVNKH